MTEGGESSSARELDQTPTWALTVVCATIVLISILLENMIHKIGKYLQEGHKKALYEALEKIKSELMVVGFISLILTFGQKYISRVCITTHAAGTMLPCLKNHTSLDAAEHGNPNQMSAAPKHHKPGQTATEHNKTEAETVKGKGEEEGKGEGEGEGGGGTHRRLLWYERRFLTDSGGSVACKEGYVPLISVNGLHQLHIFIFFLAFFNVMYSCVTMLLGRLKIREWKIWEGETINDYELSNDPSRFRLTHETSFVREHATSFWTKTPFLFYTVCFFRQFFRPVRRADYLTMRHGFISVHLAPGTKFDFQKYIKRSLEDDFKVVVGISPELWASAMLFMLLNVHGWQAIFVATILPLVVILAVGMKLQAIIAQMAVEIQQRHAVVQGIPLVQVSDRNFWFGWPQLILHLIHFTLFQNAFQITYFFWIWYEFGLKSCFNDNLRILIVRVIIGFIVQYLCSYSTLPLYALVTQMGSQMKKTIFDEQTSKALRKWHMNAVKKDGKPAAAPARTLGGSPRGSPHHSSPKSQPFSNNAARQDSNPAYDMDEIVLSPRQPASRN